jgi:hypothetical protein
MPPDLSTSYRDLSRDVYLHDKVTLEILQWAKPLHTCEGHSKMWAQMEDPILGPLIFGNAPTLGALPSI